MEMGGVFRIYLAEPVKNPQNIVLGLRVGHGLQIEVSADVLLVFSDFSGKRVAPYQIDSTNAFRSASSKPEAE